MIRIQLPQAEATRLQELFQATDNRKLRDRLQIVLMAHRGRPRQDIAADGAFSLGMVAEFLPWIEAAPHHYRQLFWEAGAVGQVLYLQSEAAGVRSTGIGCYFDDLFHQVLGLQDARFQSLYHFTVGGAVEDPRLTTLPPYGGVRLA